MFQHGLLFLAYKPSQIASILTNVGSYFRFARKNVSKTLYVTVQSDDSLRNPGKNSQNPTSPGLGTQELLSIIPRLYVEAHKFAPLLDVRVLHSLSPRRTLAFQPEALFCSETIGAKELRSFYSNNFAISNSDKIEVLSLEEQTQTNKHPEVGEEMVKFDFSQVSPQVYKNVCLGGTFDNLHNGHKIMLSTALIKTTNSLTIGVTDRSMVQNKKLWQLIAEPKVRIDKLTDYLKDVQPNLEYKIVEIADPFGPAIVDETLEAIVVSEETKRGGEKINEIRAGKNMSLLEVETIGLLGEEHREYSVEEEKVSSSSLRMRKLGTMLKEYETKNHLPQRPHLIGLTGMIASGKSSIAKKFQQLGAGVVNVDEIAHKVYATKDKPAYKEIVEAFGDQILDPATGLIDRKKLGSLVFQDPAKLQTLNGIVWPKVEGLIQEEVQKLAPKHEIVVLEVALLIEAGLHDKMHQVWLTILDENEVVKRLKDRNNLNEEEARKRIASMMPVKEKLPHADVIFCTNWDESVTWQQVHRAWKLLTDKLAIDQKTAQQ